MADGRISTDTPAGLSRRGFLRLGAIAGGAALLAACQAAPASQPAVATAPPPAAKPTAAAPAAPAQTVAPAVKSAEGTKEWDDLVAKAKQEAALTIYGPPGVTFRRIHVDEFQKKFPDIKIDYQGANGSQQAPKLASERQASKFIADLYIGGATSPMSTLLPINAFDPIEEAFVLPEVKDKSSWFGGEYTFMEKAGKYVFAFVGNAGATEIVRNTKAVSENDVTTWAHLLDEKWKGKITSADPASSGTALGNLTDIAADPRYGLDYLKKLYTKSQGVVITGDDRQHLDWIAQGQHPLGIGVREVEEAIRTGLPVLQKRLDVVTISPAFGCIMLVNKAPHPSAARVYINWLLSREGQIAYQNIQEDASLRMDIPRDKVDPAEVPDPKVKYINTQKEEFLPRRQEVRKVVAEAQAG